MATAQIDEGFDYRPSASLEEQKIAKVYAEALLNSAEKRGMVEDIKEELRQLVVEAFARSPKFAAVLASDAISQKRKDEFLRKTLQGRTSELLFNFLMVLNRHGRLGILRSVYPAYVELDNKRRSRLPVKVTTAVPMTEEQRQRLEEDLRNGFQLQPILQTVVDPDILGGMILQVSDWMFDASVRGELSKIRKELLSRSSYEIQSRRDYFSN